MDKPYIRIVTNKTPTTPSVRCILKNYVSKTTIMLACEIKYNKYEIKLSNYMYYMVAEGHRRRFTNFPSLSRYNLHFPNYQPNRSQTNLIKQ